MKAILSEKKYPHDLIELYIGNPGDLIITRDDSVVFGEIFPPFHPNIVSIYNVSHIFQLNYYFLPNSNRIKLLGKLFVFENPAGRIIKAVKVMDVF
jgi:hypothetical protein